MTPEEYKERITGINHAISVLSQQIKDTDAEFIATNRVFADGEKVKITNSNKGTTQYGFIRSAKVHWLVANAVEYIIAKCKKDGTMSHQNHYLWDNDKIEKITE